MKPRAFLAVALAVLASCSGGGGGSSTPAPPAPSNFTDPVVYSSAANASLASAQEITATTRRSIVLNGATQSYTAKVGHLTALAMGSAQPQASMFYVAYTLDGADPATRPITFFYNGGPGSASVWLHLGSFGPRRIATDTPGAGGSVPYPLVDNAETLLDTTDLVFVDMVGSGYSQAIAPFTNQSFWGVDADAAIFRDFIVRFLEVNNRGASPRFLFGESYGTTRSAVLANLLETAGVSLKGVVLLSSALDYNSNCGITDSPLSCAAHLPTYHAAAAWFHLANPDPPADGLEASLAGARVLGDTQWDPAVRAFLANHTPPDPLLVTQLASTSGISVAGWQQHFNLSPEYFQQNLLAGRMTGLYDARVNAPNGSPLAIQGDPSSTYIGASFGQRIVEYFRGELGYTTPSGYTMLSRAIDTWTFRHAGRAVPDTVPDLGAAMAHNPRLKVFSTGGYHDLVTPFHVTERDVDRLGANPNVVHRFYSGGHMTYLDDAARRRQKADVAQFMRSAL